MGNLVLRTQGLLNIQEALAELGIGYATIFRWIKKGMLASVTIDGRTYVTQFDVDRLKSQRQNDNTQGKTGGIST